LLHELSNDLGALRLRIAICAKAPPGEVEVHHAAASRLAGHSEELVRELREALQLDGKPAPRR
jgi:hypothetical protein